MTHTPAAENASSERMLNDKKVKDFVRRLFTSIGDEGQDKDLIKAAVVGYTLAHQSDERAFVLKTEATGTYVYVHVVCPSMPFLQDSLVMYLREKAYQNILALSLFIDDTAQDARQYLLIRLLHHQDDDISKLDKLFENNLEETKSELKKINS